MFLSLGDESESVVWGTDTVEMESLLRLTSMLGSVFRGLEEEKFTLRTAIF